MWSGFFPNCFEQNLQAQAKRIGQFVNSKWPTMKTIQDAIAEITQLLAVSPIQWSKLNSTGESLRDILLSAAGEHVLDANADENGDHEKHVPEIMGAIQSDLRENPEFKINIEFFELKALTCPIQVTTYPGMVYFCHIDRTDRSFLAPGLHFLDAEGACHFCTVHSPDSFICKVCPEHLRFDFVV
eukprot:m.646766 g.646766  ORF g.646766 m.646766 type:complete len:185 (+) comp58369_c0_seq8:2138-2692(+)